jgi:hypothetical protein
MTEKSERTGAVPRSHKFTIGDRIEITALDVLEVLAAVHESASGTQETVSPAAGGSVH